MRAYEGHHLHFANAVAPTAGQWDFFPDFADAGVFAQAGGDVFAQAAGDGLTDHDREDFLLLW
jgi:hypothetical protein